MVTKHISAKPRITLKCCFVKSLLMSKIKNASSKRQAKESPRGKLEGKYNTEDNEDTWGQGSRHGNTGDAGSEGKTLKYSGMIYSWAGKNRTWKVKHDTWGCHLQNKTGNDQTKIWIFFLRLHVQFQFVHSDNTVLMSRSGSGAETWKLCHHKQGRYISGRLVIDICGFCTHKCWNTILESEPFQYGNSTFVPLDSGLV